MPKLIILILILSVSCQENKFELEQCIQKPDENTVWQIKSIEGNSATVLNSQNPDQSQKITLSSSWIKTKCR